MKLAKSTVPAKGVAAATAVHKRAKLSSRGAAVTADPDLSAAAATPMMAQYLDIKAQHKDCLLFYRMGDFFELFFEDAEKASAALGIVLTKRGKNGGEDIPMCGVPVVRAEEYLHKLIAQGFRVAVCEQLENPAEAKKRGAKSVVKRGVVRLVTPGTITEDSLLEARANHFLTSLFREPGGEAYALASLDLSTGELLLSEVSEASLSGELARLAPAEILASDDDDAFPGATALPSAHFRATAGEAALKSALGIAHLDAFGPFTRDELAAAGALLHYAAITQAGKMPALRPPRRTNAADFMTIDAASRASLELTRAGDGAKGGSLLVAIDRTITAGGARELALRLGAPLMAVEAIHARLDAVSFFLAHAGPRMAVRAILRRMPDMPRALSRLALGRGGPRDLGQVRDALNAARELRAVFQPGAALALHGAELVDIGASLASADDDLARRLDEALVSEPPLLAREGGFIRDGWSAALDEARRLSRDGRSVIAGLEAQYARETGIKSLKIKHNNVLGYFLEAPAGAARPLAAPPLDAMFRHRQTVSNAMRFVTAELSGIEDRMLAASEEALRIESEAFTELAAEIAKAAPKLLELAAAIAALDCACALAELAEEQGYVRSLIDRSSQFEIVGGRHPVVEQALKKSRGHAFAANDCRLGEEARLCVMTGPNMAGKSTYLRQNAVIAIMAQMGSFVPANSARIGVIDKLFSRVGASDDLARGRSTFMVEMTETAAILHQATERSFVILDEIGRGTATFDGLSIAWGCLEYLHDVIGCRALFATHYHELTALAGRLPRAANATMAVKEWRDEIVFLHQVRAGAADRSYGIQVARLAGLPPAVIARARAVLAQLEGGRGGRKGAELLDSLPLFAAAEIAAAPGRVEEALAAIEPDAMTPRQALEALYKLKSLLP